jgi:predicted  nucleic acid-binding Zn-ribbon protein
MMDQQKQKFKVEFLRIIEERQSLIGICSNRLKIADSENNLLKIKSQEELISALKDSSSSARRLSEWHSRMSKLQLNDLSLNRDLNRSRESCEALSRELASSVARITQLEEDYVNLQQEMYCKQLEWEYRIDGLENQLSQNDEEREQILLAASSPEVILVVVIDSLNNLFRIDHYL